jgi:competence protein ComEC
MVCLRTAASTRAGAQFPSMPPPILPVRAPLLWLLLPMMAGLSAAKVWPPPGIGLGAFLVLAALAAIAALWASWQDQPRLGMVALTIAAGLEGFVLLHLREPRLHHWETRPPRELAVTLEITDLFRASPGARSTTGVAVITAAGEHDQGLLGQRVYFSAVTRISVPPQRGASYQVRGVLEPLPRETEGFNGYLANLGVRHRLVRARLVRESAPPGRLERVAGRVRDHFEWTLRHGLDAHPEIASLYLAMMLGEQAALSAEQENAFMRSGTFHVFSVSGLHVGVIALALGQLFRAVRLPRRGAALATLAGLWVYVQITGTGTPAVRAYVMIAFLLSSEIFRLPGNALAALTASAWVTLLRDPLELFSTGFQMSYSVVAALILLGGPLADRWMAYWQPFVLRPRPEWRWWHEGIHWTGRQAVAAAAGCWAAFLASTPSGIGYFGVFSPGSLPANLLILPLSTLAIVAGFVSLVCGLAGVLPLSVLFNSAAAIIILVADWLVRVGTTVPGVYFPAEFRAAWLVPAGMAAMTAVLLAGAAGRWRSRFGGFWPPVVVLLLLLAFGVRFGGP